MNENHYPENFLFDTDAYGTADQYHDVQDNDTESPQLFDFGFDLNLSENNYNDSDHHTNSRSVASENTLGDEEVVPTNSRIGTTYQTWLAPEDTSLASAWLNVSNDPIVGSNQKGKAFWKRVLEMHKENGGSIYDRKNEMQVIKHWGEMKKWVGKFLGNHATITRRNCSGYNENKIMIEAYNLFQKENRINFKHEHVWRLVKDEPKWLAYMELEAHKVKRTKTSASGAYTSSSNGETSNNEDVEESQVRTIQRPIGHKQAKRKAKAKAMESDLGNISETSSRMGAYSDANLKKAAAMTNLSEAIKRQNEIKEMELEAQLLAMDTSNMNETQLRIWQKKMEILSRKWE